jgi:hypothetical protein
VRATLPAVLLLLLQAAATSAAPQAPATKSRGRSSKSKAAQAAAAAAAGGSGAEAAAAAAEILEDDNKLKLAGLVAVMGRLALTEPLVRVCQQRVVDALLVLSAKHGQPSAKHRFRNRVCPRGGGV